MKKIVIISLMLLFAFPAFAKETVTIVYAWSPSDGPANYDRALVEAANKIQDKYTFIFDSKSGAGGGIAAQHVGKTPNTILATASAFFIRPNFFPNESYDLNNYKELMPQCFASMAITASKYKTWKEVPTDKPLTIGVSGLGTTTHLLATQIQSKYPNITVIPFKSTSDSLLSMVSGNTDLHVAFLGEVESWSKEKSKGSVNVLGITGTQVVRGFPTLVSEGFSNAVGSMNAPFHLIVPANLSNEKFQAWRNILVAAAKSSKVHESYQPDACSPADVREVDLQPWYYSQVAFWRKLSTGVKIDK